eukprot:269300-Pelagomonas_calceolata.AAC.14
MDCITGLPRCRRRQCGGPPSHPDSQAIAGQGKWIAASASSLAACPRCCTRKTLDGATWAALINCFFTAAQDQPLKNRPY